jgi:hypothetical protein
MSVPDRNGPFCSSSQKGLTCKKRPHSLGEHIGIDNDGTVVRWPRLIAPATPPGSGSQFTGDTCVDCLGIRMIRTGVCSTCLDCGGSGGCG